MILAGIQRLTPQASGKANNKYEIRNTNDEDTRLIAATPLDAASARSKTDFLYSPFSAGHVFCQRGIQRLPPVIPA